MSEQDRPMQLMQLVSNCHLCFQLYAIDQSLDFEEFRQRLDADNIDYRQVLIDNQDILERWGEFDPSRLYIQRVIDLLYPVGE